MADPTEIERLRRAETEPDLDAMAEAIGESVLQRVQELAELAASMHEVTATKARAVIVRLQTLAVLCLLRLPCTTPEQEIRAARMLLDAEFRSRQRMAMCLRQRLGDLRPVPLPSDRGLKEEVVPPPRRICDEACLALRRLLHAAETPEDYWLNAEAFLNLPAEQRDAEIAAVKGGGAWTNFIEREP